MKELQQALGVLRKGKRDKIDQKDLVAAAKVVNRQNNRRLIHHMVRLGYSEQEAKTLIYTAP